MSAAARNLSAGSLLMTLVSTQVRQLLTYRKTKALAVIQLLPVIGAAIYVFMEDVDGLMMFTGVTENLIFPFLIPLAALFYGGPAIVDEMEGRTLTYLTLRPIPKPILFVGKLIAGWIVALALVLIPLALLFVACLIKSNDFGASMESFGQILLAASCGTLAYSAIFAALGAFFASSLLASIIYFVIFEMVMAVLPILELVSVRYHLRTAAGFSATDRLGMLDKLVLDEPIVLGAPVGVGIAIGVTIIATALGAYIFSQKTYHV